jgi:flagellar protein FliO/FliZ
MLSVLALVLGAAAPPLVGHAASTFAGDQLTLVVRTNGPVPQGARGEVVGGVLRVRLPGASLGQPAYAFQDPAGGVVRAQQPKPGEVVFDVPLPDGRTCPGPVVFDPPRRPGVVAHVACPDASAAVAAPAQAPAKEDPPPASAPQATPEPEPANVAKADPAASPREEPSSPWGALGPVFLLAALALAAWIYAQRKAAPSRQLQVVESVSLGPRRQLIVARFRDELLVVGSSESGITLLASRPGGQGALVPAAASAHAPQPPAAAAPLPAAPAATPADPALDAGSLKALAERMARQAEGARPPDAAPPKSFESLLDESYEDENLRRKLAKGLGGRVS